MKKVYVERNCLLTSQMFKDEGWEVVSCVEDADLVCFKGGPDVSPELYGEQNTRSTVDVRRDFQSLNLYIQALNMGIPCAGICRGAQFLNVMNGGKMVQHIDDHAITGTHLVVLDGGTGFQATSTHHQMMVPSEISEVTLSGYAPFEVAEVLVYENDLCFQPHPEFDNGVECRKVFFELLEYLGV